MPKCEFKHRSLDNLHLDSPMCTLINCLLVFVLSFLRRGAGRKEGEPTVLVVLLLGWALCLFVR